MDLHMHRRPLDGYVSQFVDRTPTYVRRADVTPTDVTPIGANPAGARCVRVLVHCIQ